jgi:hypothetical protein
MWVVVDPFGFKGIMQWKAAIVEAIAKGEILTVYLLILRIWYVYSCLSVYFELLTRSGLR